MKKVAICDYGMGNLDSVSRAVEECGGYPMVTAEYDDFRTATHIIIPGVGAFADGMRNIRERHLDEILTEQVIGQKVPCLGLCLGMQLLATKGAEVRETLGLGWIEGEVVRLNPTGEDRRIPHIGWNEVVFKRQHPLFDSIPDSKDFYFVHSYHFVCEHEEDILATTPYCGDFVSVVGRGNIFGVQCHPEKSQVVGFQLLRNFLRL